jgi:hypothetical protein
MKLKKNSAKRWNGSGKMIGPASRVVIYRDGSIEDSDQRLAESHSVDHLLKLNRVFGRRLTESNV